MSFTFCKIKSESKLEFKVDLLFNWIEDCLGVEILFIGWLIVAVVVTVDASRKLKRFGSKLRIDLVILVALEPFSFIMI
jgi:hypothetical protein